MKNVEMRLPMTMLGRAGLKLGFSKAIPSGRAFSLELDWGVVQGLSSPTLGEEAYTTDLSSRMTWEQPLGRDPKTMEPWWSIQAAEDAYNKAKPSQGCSRP